MNLERRDFLKVLSAGALTAGNVTSVFAGIRKTLSADAVGILYDGTICIGCKACEAACKQYNDMPPESANLEKATGVDGIWDESYDLSEKTLNKIKLYEHGDASTHNSEENGFAFVIKAWMHCVDPDCVSACPVTALVKNDATGIVEYDKDACIGCRYCMVACPYNVPKFEYAQAIPEIVKCELCNHRQAEGGIPACCEFCPTGASLFGKVTDLLEEARKRIKLVAGSTYEYPMRSLDEGDVSPKTVAPYINYIYGEKEGGGTQYLLLSAIPFTKLGLPELSATSSASKSEGIQHGIYKGMIAPIALLGGLLYGAYQTTKNSEG